MKITLLAIWIGCTILPHASMLHATAPSAPDNLLHAGTTKAGATLRGAGLGVSVASTGAYTLHYAPMHLVLSGSLPERPGTIRTASGADSVGAYQQIEAEYAHGGRVAVVRLYAARGAVLFLDKHRRVDPNTAPFPSFSGVSANLKRFSYRVAIFSPIDFGKLDAQGPWVFFDQNRNTFVLSPADNFLVSDLEASADSVEVQMSSGISTVIPSLPSSFTHGTWMVFGKGITHTQNLWGDVLQRMNHKAPVANDADVLLNKFGYWTDNGATYYYKFIPSLGYEGTLLAVRDRFQQMGVPLGYMQLDSWWYPKSKGRSGAGNHGELLYRADPSIFPDGLASFHQRLQLPLATHARWISKASPYRSQYKMSRNVIIDPRFWHATADYLHADGVVVYEQDWLNQSARPAIDLSQSQAFLQEMADNMAARDIAIQYCMALPGYFMASTQFQNLRTIRVSDDRFLPARYDNFLYTSALAHAVGLWPWSDVFMSSELSNLVLSTLSAGPVGTGDALQSIDVANLERALRADSVILKPDTPLVPVDSTYIEDASADASGSGFSKAPMIATTQTDFGSSTETYVFSYPREAAMDAANAPEASVSLASLGVKGSVYAWNWRQNRGILIPANGTLFFHYIDGWDYTVLAPVNQRGIALLGDVSKIVPLARKRFASVSNTKTVQATVFFAKDEHSVVLTGFSQHQPEVRARLGAATGLTYNAATHVFSFTLSPGDQNLAKVQIF
ncbi:MAG: hypothetical protein ACP5E5_04130 [Acidobacteriaceae bacterium]